MEKRIRMNTKRSVRWGLLAGLTCSAVLAMPGCELIVDFDRSKIPTGNDASLSEDGSVPDATTDVASPDGGDGGPESDAGPDAMEIPEAGEAGPDASDAGSAADSGVDGGHDGGVDAGVDTGVPDAEADAGPDAADAEVGDAGGD
jgi:hypothetical protein